MHPLIAGPAIFALVYRAYSHNSLTPLGILIAFLTALVHAAHPWSLPFVLLATFFLVGTRATKVKQAEKARLTLQSTGGDASRGEGPRTHVQVLANSICASLFILLHLYTTSQSSSPSSFTSYLPTTLFSTTPSSQPTTICFSKHDPIPYAIIANYAAVAADTLSSELGILSPATPRLITSLTLRKVPRGTNGGVTLWGLAAGVMGAGTIALASVLVAPFCGDQDAGLGTRLKGNGMGEGWTLQDKLVFVGVVTAWGALGSLLDSFLGGWLQASVVDRSSGKVVEGRGGGKVLVTGKVGKEGEKGDGKGASRRVESGAGVLDNNAVNFLMAGIMSAGAWGAVGWYFG